MIRGGVRYFFVICLTLSSVCSAQSSKAHGPTQAKDSNNDVLVDRYLVPVKTVTAAGEVATSFWQPLLCDSEGDIYLGTDHAGISGIHKVNAKGERLAVFSAHANPDLKIDVSRSFTIGPGGDLYELVYPHEITRYVMIYKGDGSYKSTIKLQPGFAWMPATIAVFPSGALLVSGLEYDEDPHNPVMWPVTGIFSSDGILLKEIKLEDDGAIRDLATYGDARVTSATDPSANYAVEYGEMETGQDGNVYVMRWTNPAIFYVISNGGEVLRRFTVDPGSSSFRPSAMHVSGQRISVLFVQPEAREKRIEIVDLNGTVVAKYAELRVDGKPKYGTIGGALACYRDNPDRFTFLRTADDDKLEILTVVPE